MTKNKRIALLVIVVNILFWLSLMVYFTVFASGMDIRMVLFLRAVYTFEAVMYGIILVGILHENQLAYFLGIVTAFLNILFSLADQVGMLDIASLVLSLLVMAAILNVSLCRR